MWEGKKRLDVFGVGAVDRPPLASSFDFLSFPRVYRKFARRRCAAVGRRFAASIPSTILASIDATASCWAVRESRITCVSRESPPELALVELCFSP